MSVRKSPSKGDRHGKAQGRDGVPVGVAHHRRTEVAVPPLAVDQARCPQCRNAVGLTTAGALRKHKDLFGRECLNTATGVCPLTREELAAAIAAADVNGED